jgi:hypothetical protein
VVGEGISFNFHGIRVRIEGANAELAKDFRHDLAYFIDESPESPAFTLILANATDRPRGWIPAFRLGKRSTLYFSWPGEKRVRFYQKAWVNYQPARGIARIYADDSKLRYEIAHLTLMSYVGEALDRRGLHRMHGLGLTLEEGGKAILVLAASGGGKSTLAIQCLNLPGVKILSDDTPLVSEHGQALAFPLRIGLKEKPPVPPQFVRTFTRAAHGTKYVISCNYFQDRIDSDRPVGTLALLRRGDVGEMSFRQVSRYALVWPLLKWLVIGYETPQIWELYLRFAPRDVLAHTRVLFSRIRAARQLWGQCHTCELFVPRMAM